jgi:hypothetical protein
MKNLVRDGAKVEMDRRLEVKVNAVVIQHAGGVTAPVANVGDPVFEDCPRNRPLKQVLGPVREGVLRYLCAVVVAVLVPLGRDGDAVGGRDALDPGPGLDVKGSELKEGAAICVALLLEAREDARVAVGPLEVGTAIFVLEKIAINLRKKANLEQNTSYRLSNALTSKYFFTNVNGM